MPKKNSLHDLFIDELFDIYHAEKQLTRALPTMAKNANSDHLRKAFEDHLKQTETQINRLDQIFQELDITVKSKRCLGMEGIINEGKEMMKEDSDPSVSDAALIASAQKVEHYEIASYGTVRAYAKELGFDNIAKLLQQTLDEESQTNEKLTTLAEKEINVEAMK